MKTKERIIYESLTLFSNKGYKGTSVKDIAEAVGIKDSSLYKHFKSKQEIMDNIMLVIKNHIEDMSINLGLPSRKDYEKAVEFYAELGENELSQLSKKIFLFYLKDDLLLKFWKLGVMEQFQNEQVYALFKKFYIEDSIKYQTALFREMSRHNIFIDVDPEVMAMSFYTPIFFLLSKYSGIEGKEEEALTILNKQIKEFYRIYRK